MLKRKWETSTSAAGKQEESHESKHGHAKLERNKTFYRTLEESKLASCSREQQQTISFTPDSKKKKREKITFDERKCQIREVYGNLFNAPPDHSLAHCVAADMRMGSGIAVNFRQTFGHLGELLDQNKYIGDVAILNDDDRFIYNLVTKKFSQGKPKLRDVYLSLLKMRKHCEENGVKNVSMPRIGCGLDRLSWEDVERNIQNAFRGLDITITVHDFTPAVDRSSSSKKRLVYITDCDVSLAYIPRGTAVLFFTSEDGSTSHNDFYLLYNMNLYGHFIRERKKLGKLVHLTPSYYRSDQNVFGLVVKRTEVDAFSYSDFEKSLHMLLTALKRMRIHSVAFESLDNSLTMAKVKSVINHVFEFSRFKFYICKPQQMQFNRTSRWNSLNY